MLLSSESTAYLQRLKSVRSHISERCADADEGRRAERLLARVERCLARPVRLVIAGEVNSGKTTLANRLLGRDLLATNVVHNTRAPLRLKYAPTASIHAQSAGGHRRELGSDPMQCSGIGRDETIEVGLPLDALDGLEIVDTPGAQLEEAEIARLKLACRGVDIIIWCTLATQAWRASEVALWASLGRRPGAIRILAITHADLLAASDAAHVRARIERETAHLFDERLLIGIDPSGSAPDLRAPIEKAANDRHVARCKRASAVVARFGRRLERAER